MVQDIIGFSFTMRQNFNRLWWSTQKEEQIKLVEVDTANECENLRILKEN